MKCGSCDKTMRKSFKADGFRICGGCERKMAEEAKRAKLNPKIEGIKNGKRDLNIIKVGTASEGGYSLFQRK